MNFGLNRFLTLCFLGVTVSCGFAEPVVSGLLRNHPLDKAEHGHVLAEELNCAACHDGVVQGKMKGAPDLMEVGSRVSSAYLELYLNDPQAVHPGTTMPDVLGSLEEVEKKKVSASIVAYLGTLTRTEGKEEAVVVGNAKQGREIYHQVGCVACHAPHDEAGKEVKVKGALSLKHLAGKYHEGELARFLADPLEVRPGGRMPDMNLSSKEAADIAAFLVESSVSRTPAPNAELVKLGKANFEKYNCASCHEAGVKVGEKFKVTDFTKGCLSEGEATGADYDLSKGQVDALRELFKAPPKLELEDQIGLKLTQLNCISCHERGDFGGVMEELDFYFHSTEEALGNEARIPPPLTGIGGKLKEGWLNKVLYDGLRVRSYMSVRMPSYGEKALAGMVELLRAEDAGKLSKVDFAPPTRETRPMVNNGGHLLLGNKGLNCIACHNYNGKESPGMKGLDLITSFQRLEPEWFNDFMRAPSKHRKGIIMPSFWPGGVAVQQDILSGDTEAQLNALWYQFSLGRSARDPSGLKTAPTKLEVGDQVRVYRGRSKVAGYRGVAVGFPEGLSYAFNAKNGSLTSLWSGEFVSANWRSQAAGDFKPVGKVASLFQDVAFIEGEIPEQWPLRPITTKEEPENPDPTYPRQHGYAFKGYFFGEKGTPTFLYKCGDVEISDQLKILKLSDDKNGFSRTFEFISEKSTTLIFRVMAGDVKAGGDGVFATPEVQVLGVGEKALLREMKEGAGKELLVPIPVGVGKTSYTLEYEILR